MMEPRDLRRMTNEAISRGKKEYAKTALEREQKKAFDDMRIRGDADLILREIPRLVEHEASKGESGAKVMQLKYNEHYLYLNAHMNKLSENNLRGAAALVFFALKEAKLNPTIEYWYSGDGMDSGYDIYVHW